MVNGIWQVSQTPTCCSDDFSKCCFCQGCHWLCGSSAIFTAWLLRGSTILENLLLQRTTACLGEAGFRIEKEGTQSPEPQGEWLGKSSEHKDAGGCHHKRHVRRDILQGPYRWQIDLGANLCCLEFTSWGPSSIYYLQELSLSTKGHNGGRTTFSALATDRIACTDDMGSQTAKEILLPLDECWWLEVRTVRLKQCNKQFFKVNRQILFVPNDRTLSPFQPQVHACVLFWCGQYSICSLCCHLANSFH